VQFSSVQFVWTIWTRHNCSRALRSVAAFSATRSRDSRTVSPEIVSKYRQRVRFTIAASEVYASPVGERADRRGTLSWLGTAGSVAVEKMSNVTSPDRTVNRSTKSTAVHSERVRSSAGFDKFFYRRVKRGTKVAQWGAGAKHLGPARYF